MSAPDNIYNDVEPYASANQVPDWLWETVVQDESGFNPEATGDQGTSFGLFQLHIGGQANNAFNQGYSQKSLYDPGVNAKFGMPAIGDAWRSLSSSFNDSYAWWIQFAIQSGHPGGNPLDPATINEATSLKRIYDSQYKGQAGNDNIVTSMTKTNTKQSSPGGLDVLGFIERGVFFLLGGILLVVGTTVIAKGSVGVPKVKEVLKKGVPK